MGYVDPTKVTAPQRRWELKKVLLNTGQGGWSIARGLWDKHLVLVVRWNGADDKDGFGNPQSRGHPTWFVIPEELESAMLMEADRLTHTMGVVTCKIYRPENHDFGAWRIKAHLNAHVRGALGNNSLVFQLPSLANRMCRADKGYVRASAKELQGCFVKGVWYGHLYSNGIEEKENPTQLNAFKDAFIQSVTRAVQDAKLL